ncbi:MAG TPA: phosphopyruvate hydratase [Pirellulaceae bacterium]|nr:phosphopyruvate hydratase [Planctomycetales bacterium]HRX79611.1 phosphopyruvate hydratase [Pirellulaceae bacterium]
MSSISKIHAREVLDSRGKPTVEVEVLCADGAFGRAIVPSGASTGQAEALELRDTSQAWYDGQGVRQAVVNVNKTLSPPLIGRNATDQQAIDTILLQLDDTPQKSKLGGNALLGISLAAAHAAAASQRIPLYRHINNLLASPTPSPKMPLPMINMISGGLHAGGNLDFQDVLISPVGAPDYRTGLEWTVRVYRRLGELLTRAGYEGRLVGDEGGYGPRLKGNRDAVEFVVRAIEAAKLRPGDDVTIALDVAATHFVQPDGSYRLVTERDVTLTSGDMIERLNAWAGEFPITSIEDGLAEEDWSGWQELTRRLGGRVQLVGDDLFTTNEHRITKGIELGVGNSVLIKVNQIGTLTEALRSIATARSAGYSLVVSARSGETEDTTIADLAVGVAAEQIKIGSIVRSERLAKYNQLLRIAEKL